MKPSPGSHKPWGWKPAASSPSRFQQNPRTIRPRTPGSILVRRPVWLDGRSRDSGEAARDFAAEPWAKKAKYLGQARGWHLWERAQ